MAGALTHRGGVALGEVVQGGAPTLAVAHRDPHRPGRLPVLGMRPADARHRHRRSGAHEVGDPRAMANAAGRLTTGPEGTPNSWCVTCVE